MTRDEAKIITTGDAINMNIHSEAHYKSFCGHIDKIYNDINTQECKKCAYYDNKCLNAREETRGFCVKFGLTIGFIKSNFGKDFGCNKFEREE